MVPTYVRAAGDGSHLDLYVTPRASRSRVVGEHDGRLKVQIAAPPVDGAANDEVVRLVARLAGVSRRSVSIARGDTGRRKTVAVDGVAPEDLAQRLSDA